MSGVVYATPPGIRGLELDLYLPADDVCPPVVVFLHGGGWRAGDRRWAGDVQAGDLFAALLDAGIAVVSVDYRLSSEAHWPAPLVDVLAAITYLQSRAEDLGVDVTRLGLWGESAGGHLALLAAVGASAGDPDQQLRRAVTGPVLSWYAPTDLTTCAGDLGHPVTDADSRESQLLGHPVTERVERVREASPALQVSAPFVEGRPFLLLHGADDSFVAPRQSQRMRDALHSAGAQVDLRLLHGAGHVWTGSDTARQEAFEATTTFFSRWLLHPADGDTTTCDR
ncbi:alpha/beta hydrolase [Kineococcus rhizosphaerae]|uniref:alpha/beta hydrolase n=1 Tax=Kineococcus rhizosphaerae TaxID=559628 RepID=UPI0014767A0E|nr:alpha/beta hydrolase [Kineococcus rhizosphaerae]